MGGWLCTRRRSVVVVMGEEVELVVELFVSLLVGCCPLAIGQKRRTTSRADEGKLMDGGVFFMVEDS
jgi:hypothetical protein